MNDIIAGGGGVDDLDGGGGADIIISGDPRSIEADAQNDKSEKLNGGTGSDYIVLTPDSRIVNNFESKPDIILQKGAADDRIFVTQSVLFPDGAPVADDANVPIHALLGGGYGYIASGPPGTPVDPDKNLNFDSNGEINRVYHSGNATYSHYFEAGKLEIGAGSLYIRIENFEEGDYGIYFMDSPVIIAYEWDESVGQIDVVRFYE